MLEKTFYRSLWLIAISIFIYYFELWPTIHEILNQIFNNQVSCERRVYTAEEVAKMSPEELREVIKRTRELAKSIRRREAVLEIFACFNLGVFIVSQISEFIDWYLGI